MKNLTKKLRNLGIATSLAGCVFGSGCETMTPSEQAAVFGLVTGISASNPDLTYQQQAVMQNLSGFGYTLSQQETMKEAAREGRSEVNVNVNTPQQENTKQIKQTGLTPYEELSFNEYPGEDLQFTKIFFDVGRKEKRIEINGKEMIEGENIGKVNLYFIGAGWIILRDNNNNLYKLKQKN